MNRMLTKQDASALSAKTRFGLPSAWYASQPMLHDPLKTSLMPEKPKILSKSTVMTNIFMRYQGPPDGLE